MSMSEFVLLVKAILTASSQLLGGYKLAPPPERELTLVWICNPVCVIKVTVKLLTPYKSCITSFFKNIDQ